MDKKAFWKSKTFWINILAVAAMLLKDVIGFEIGPETSVAILGGINLILRLITKEPIDWKTKKGAA